MPTASSSGIPGTDTGSRLAVIIGSRSTEPERNAARILGDRVMKRSRVEVRIATDEQANEVMRWAHIVFSVGSPDTNPLSMSLMEQLGTQLPTLPDSSRLHPEGFVVRSGRVRGKPLVVVAGADGRGTIYGVGGLLRAITFLSDRVEVPCLDLKGKPAFWLRGGSPNGPGSLARERGNLRPRRAEEQRETLEDLLLLGVNIVHGDPELLEPFGIMTSTTASRRAANEMPIGPDGTRRVPRAWAADGGMNDKLLCPSIPEARQSVLDSFEEAFGGGPHHDVFFIKSGDPGGCNCARCMPWGRTYIELVREIAGILHKHDPGCRVIATNQDLTSENNQALLDYLNAHDSSWLYAISYGPGSDEMQTYYRGPVNPGWFEYEGFGPLGNYLKHIHHELPGNVAVSLFSDITHWMQAQYGVPCPDPSLAAVFGRQTWNARPRRLHEVARETLHYAVGDMPYSEGMHDDFNKRFAAYNNLSPCRSAPPRPSPGSTQPSHKKSSFAATG